MKLLFFTAPWCATCKRMKEDVLPKVYDETKIEIEMIDCDDEKTAQIRSKYMVMGCPTTIIETSDGRFERLLNFQSAENIIEAINSVR